VRETARMTQGTSATSIVRRKKSRRRSAQIGGCRLVHEIVGAHFWTEHPVNLVIFANEKNHWNIGGLT
jgi:hypothetical protein